MNPTRCALITGGTGGIGRGMVQAFTNRGYTVVGLDKLAQPDGFEGQHYVQVDLQKLLEDDAVGEGN